MPEVAFDLNFPPMVAESARDIFEMCRNNRHMWVDASHEELAGASLYCAAVRYQQSRYPCFADVVDCFGIDASKVLNLLTKIKELLLHFDARAALDAFLHNLEKASPDFLPRVKVLAPLILRLWNEVSSGGIFKADLIHAHWQRIIARCIFAVLLSNDVFIEICAIWAAVGACQLGDFGHRLDVEVALLVIDRKDYSLSARKIKARKIRKLKQRVQQQQTMQDSTMLRISLDALLVSVPVIRLRKDHFRLNALEENQEHQGQPPKRRRVIGGRRKPIKRVA